MFAIMFFFFFIVVVLPLIWWIKIYKKVISSLSTELVGQLLSLNITASVQNVLFRPHRLLRRSSIAPSTRCLLQRLSINRCLSSATFWTGIWYIRSCIEAHIRQSVGLRSELFRSHKSGGMNYIGVSRCSITQMRQVSQLLCCKNSHTYLYSVC